jgi:hypothetical protein
MSQVSLGYQGVATFTLSNPVRSADGELMSVEASIEYDDLSACVTVWAHYAKGFDDLIEFFDELANNWRGWVGEKSYWSLEGELKLYATNNGVGPVRLTAHLRAPNYPIGWELTAPIGTDPGTQMEDAASSTRELLLRRSNPI